ncbi:subtilisin-like protein [Lactarius quietus]|nr:subtilisin-like protein [Lactarius quietus]
MRTNWLSVLGLSALSAATLVALPTPHSLHWGDMRVKHAWRAVPANWESIGHPPAGTSINLYIALKPHRENALIDALYDVSQPRHPKYGAHLSKEQVAELVAPHPNTLELVYSWLEHHGVPFSSVSRTHGGSWLTLTGIPVSRANELLGASYQVYRHSETKDCVLRTVGYALPAVLQAHVKTVAPTTYFGSPQTLRKTLHKHSAAALDKSASGEHVNVLSSRVDFVSPSHLRTLYQMESYVPVATDRNMLGVAGYFSDWPSQEDLSTFMKTYRSDGVDARFILVDVGDQDRPDGPSEEANVDIQYTEALAYPTPNIFYSMATEEDFLEWANYMLALESLPQTISISYGDEEQEFSEAYAIELCELYARLGARGASLLFASGNDGVGRGNCISNDGSGKLQFLPTFPASCPFVTAVGGTIDDRETAAPFSSGGFSNYFKRQPFQEGAVRTYFDTLGDQYRGLYNASSRGFPDISAQADKFVFILNGETRGFRGTSCAAPTVAGVVALLNDYRLSTGQRPLGWLNPWLYDDGNRGLNDITSGSNPGCMTAGFSAITGWDPVTGLGTPDFDKLLGILRAATPSPTPLSSTSS